MEKPKDFISWIGIRKAAINLIKQDQVMQAAPETRTPQSSHGPGVRSSADLSLTIYGVALYLSP